MQNLKYNLDLENYYGPFDLLIDLISKNKIDIYDIPISEITEQFIDYIEKTDFIDIDLASDFMLMASKLLEIKSKFLIPVEEKEFEEDPRIDLSESIIEYKIYKDISLYFKEVISKETSCVFKPADDINNSDEDFIDLKYELDILKDIFLDLMKKNKIKIEEDKTNKVLKDRYSVSKIAGQIYNLCKKNKYIMFSELFNQNIDMDFVVSNFLAILNLLSKGYIDTKQESIFSDIKIIYKGEKNGLQRDN